MVQFREKRATGTVCYLVQINYFCILSDLVKGVTPKNQSYTVQESYL